MRAFARILPTRDSRSMEATTSPALTVPERWSLESFPWARQPGVNRKQMRSFAELDFVARHENLVLTGPPDPETFCTSLLHR